MRKKRSTSIEQWFLYSPLFQRNAIRATSLILYLSFHTWNFNLLRIIRIYFIRYHIVICFFSLDSLLSLEIISIFYLVALPYRASCLYYSSAKSPRDTSRASRMLARRQWGMMRGIKRRHRSPESRWNRKILPRKNGTKINPRWATTSARVPRMFLGGDRPVTCRAWWSR